MQAVPIELDAELPKNCNFIFNPSYPEAYAHLVDADMKYIHIQNDSDYPLHLNTKNTLGKIVEMKEEECYNIDKNSHRLTARHPD